MPKTSSTMLAASQSARPFFSVHQDPNAKELRAMPDMAQHGKAYDGADLVRLWRSFPFLSGHFGPSFHRFLDLRHDGGS